MDSRLLTLRGLKSIDLTNNSIKISPLNISNLKNLETFYLIHVHSSRIPSNLSNAKQIKYLNLNSNNFKLFPKEIFKLTNFKEIVLVDCKIENYRMIFID